MGKECAICGIKLGVFDKCFKYSNRNTSIYVCPDCNAKVAIQIDNISSIKSVSRREKTAEEFENSNTFGKIVDSCIAETALINAMKAEPSINLNINGGGDKIGLGFFSNKVVMRQNTDGYVYFDTNMNIKYRLNGYHWDGPKYQNITQNHQVSNTKGKAKTKNKGGLGGALIGTLIAPGAGTVAGYMMTKKKVTKDKSRTETNGTTTETQEEIMGNATMSLLNPSNNSIFTIGFECNSTINAILEQFDWGNKANDQILESKANQIESESNKIELLKQYKELYDSDIISKEEFEAKKKELIG